MSFLLIHILLPGSVWKTSAECRTDRAGCSVPAGQGARVLSSSRELENVEIERVLVIIIDDQTITRSVTTLGWMFMTVGGLTRSGLWSLVW